MSKTLTGLALPGLLCLSGCAGSLITGDGEQLRIGSAAFAEYAEQVFRDQNEVLDRLAFALDGHPENAALIAAEDQVLAACQGLNEIAVRQQRGEGIRPLRDARTARAVPVCEEAAAAAAELLGNEAR